MKKKKEKQVIKVCQAEILPKDTKDTIYVWCDCRFLCKTIVLA